ncbi:hypothetical protein [Saccharicrinis sp. GN24d3]|uniref:hypothetical protein n=1 Tax=Saccharicrinis sp. GN24d3 TaxID=3458416 RepID=UPI00403688CC
MAVIIKICTYICNITDGQRSGALNCYHQAVGCTNKSPLAYVESPCIDALATEAVLSTNAYCNSPEIWPSHGSKYTGQNPYHSAINFLHTMFMDRSKSLKNNKKTTGMAETNYPFVH